MKRPNKQSVLTREAVCWGIIAGAFLLRLLAIGVYAWHTPAAPLSIDALSYHQTAQNLVRRGLFTSTIDPPYDLNRPSTFRPPLTPLFLAAIYRLCGVNLLWGQVGLAAISALACGLIYWLATRLFDQQVGGLAGLLGAVYPFFLFLALVPLTEGLSIVLSLGLLGILYASSHTESLGFGPAIGIGLVFGLALLNKASNIVLLPSIAYWGLVLTPGRWTSRGLRLVATLTTTVLLICPWAIRNQRIVGAFTPINSNGGWTFYLGNNAYTDINLRDLETGKTNGWIPPKKVFRPFKDLAFENTRAYEKRAIRLGLTFIRKNPGTSFAFAIRKLKIFWSPYAHIVDQLSWYPLAALSLLGLALSLRAWEEHLMIYLLLLASMSIPVVFTSMPRFRAPIMPFLLIYSASGLVYLYKLTRCVISSE